MRHSFFQRFFYDEIYQRMCTFTRPVLIPPEETWICFGNLYCIWVFQVLLSYRVLRRLLPLVLSSGQILQSLYCPHLSKFWVPKHLFENILSGAKYDLFENYFQILTTFDIFYHRFWLIWSFFLLLCTHWLLALFEPASACVRKEWVRNLDATMIFHVNFQL